MAASPSGLSLKILGPLRVWRDGVELDPGPRQQAYLLALLIARAGQPISGEELIDLVWDDDAPASARNVLHKYVGALRRLLEPGLPARRVHARVSGSLEILGDERGDAPVVLDDQDRGAHGDSFRARCRKDKPAALGAAVSASGAPPAA